MQTRFRRRTGDVAFLEGGGACGALLRARDWTGTRLGAPEGWPPGLKLTLRLALSTQHPMFIFWGEEHLCFYNDAYSRSLGPERHPSALGSPGREVWDEIWPVIGPQIAQVLSGGGATWHENHLVPITRNGRREDVWWTYSYSPIDDPFARGGVGGVLVLVSETTPLVLAEKRGVADAEKLRELFRAAPGFIATVRGPDHVYEIANDAYLALVGRRALSGQSIRDALPEVGGQGYFEMLDRVYATGETVTQRRSRVLFRNAETGAEEERFVDFVLQPMRDAAGAVDGIFMQGADVTESVRAERAAEARWRELETIYAAMPVGVALLDRQFRLVRTNDRFVAKWGLTNEGRAGKTLHDALPSDADEARRAAVALQRQLVDGEAAENVEIVVPDRSSGSLRTLLVSCRPIGNGRDDGGFTLCTALDISARKLAEEAVLESEARLNLALDAANAGTWHFNPKDGTAGWDERYGRLFGLEPGPAFDPGIWLARVASDDRARVEARIAAMLATPGDDAWREEFRVVTAKGERWMLNVGEARRENDGTVAMISGINIDISDLKAAQRALAEERDRVRASEAALARLNATLEQRVTEAVEERTRALAALHESQKLESIGQLTGGLAHDFNNLLAAALSNLELLGKRHVGDARSEKLLQVAVQAVERGVGLTRRLLAFARRQDLHAVAVDVPGLIAGMRDLLDRSLGPNVAVRIQASPGVPRASADANQLELALLNLALNARDAMPGGGEIVFAVDVAEPPETSGLEARPFVRLAVHDSGVGMDEATARRAVEPFFTTKGVGKGTGLGLSMVQGLALQSGGAMRILSRTGEGTTVEVFLPLAESDAPATSLPALQQMEEPSRRLKVLVVDDDFLVCMGTAAMVEDLGHDVVEAHSGVEALAAIAREGDIDIVVTDQGMPGMAGTELARRVRAQHPHLPIILATGYAELADDPGLPRLGKPFTQAQLAQALRGELGGVEGR